MDCIRPETITLRSVECELARPRDISLEFFLVSVVSGIEIRVEGEKTWMAILPAVPTVNSIRLARGANRSMFGVMADVLKLIWWTVIGLAVF